MTLTAKQEEGLKLAVQRYRDHEPWTCIADYRQINRELKCKGKTNERY